MSDGLEAHFANIFQRTGGGDSLIASFQPDRLIVEVSNLKGALEYRILMGSCKVPAFEWVPDVFLNDKNVLRPKARRLYF